jgi:23S rRNA A1618 N6-methylase RlmF
LSINNEFGNKSNSLKISKRVDASIGCLSLKEVAENYPDFTSYLKEGKIDLGNPKALMIYNKCLLHAFTGFNIDIPKNYLIPTICLRKKYLELIKTKYPNVQCILDIGTGASAVLGLLALSMNFNVIGTEINEESFKYALGNLKTNNISSENFKLIKSNGGIIQGVVDENNLKYIDVIVCYPPFYPDDKPGYTSKKKRGFKGNDSELFGGDSGIEFTIKMIKEAVNSQIKITSVLLHKKEFVTHILDVLKKEKEFESLNYEIVEIKAGNRLRYVLFIET